jgi:hypothetical protein
MSLEQLIPKRWAIAAPAIVALLLMPTAWPIYGFTAFLISLALRLALIVILGYHLARFFGRYGSRGPCAL